MAKRSARKSSARKSSTKKRAPARTKAAGSRSRKRPATKRAAVRTSPRPGARRSAATSSPKKKPRTRATAVRGALAGAIAAVADRMPWAGGPDAIALLETDHRRLEALLKEGEETGREAVKRRTELLDAITSELNVHELIEEKVLYPVLKAHPEATDIVLEGYQEHHLADLIVKELHGLAKDDERWGAKLKVLQESIAHHIEEEEGEMFRTARAVLSREELLQLGAEMAAMKEKAQKGAH